MNYAKIPCAECPWRRDVAVGHFSPERFVALAHCSYDMAHEVFACHMSKEGGEFACAGFLLRSAAHNLSVRMSRQSFADVRSPYRLYDHYVEMAVANGVDQDHSCLRNCRVDGQRWRR